MVRNLDTSPQHIHQHLPLQTLRELLLLQLLPHPRLRPRAKVVLEFLHLASLVVGGAERPEGVHPRAVFDEVLAAGLPAGGGVRSI